MSDWALDGVVADIDSLPLLASVDVLVVGAGAAGVAAATVTAESGLEVMIIEKYGFAGGAAVAGLSGTICGLYLASDRAHEPAQVVRGFTQRFIDELESRGGLTPPQVYGKTFTRAHDPLKWRESADQLLLQAGVEVLFHTTLVGVIMEGDDFRGVVVASNAGLSKIGAQRIVDASGDAAVVSRAGGEYSFGQNGRIQNPTMFFRIANVDTEAFWNAWGPDTISPEWVSAEIRDARERGLDLPREKIWIFDTGRPGELLVNATRLVGPEARMLNVIDPADFTIAEVDGRRQVREYARFLADSIPGCEDAYVVDTGVEAGVRQTRTVAGIATLTNDDVVGAARFDDAICRSPWPIELHDGERPKLHWIIDDYYEVPFGTLVPLAGENIIVAGRCLSAEHEALASARVTAQCFEYGHAAAVATIMSLESGTAYRRIDGREVRARMVRNGSDLGVPAGDTPVEDSFAGSTRRTE
ncbi:FAD-dependent oxidoreductase [Microbacterium sp. NPDC055910]|uniref:FAD-dependent oxidoreductase n=1 Tax=Microbacterium sp. NPDC055910 TaxID=3345659 RepID=UPI0035D97DA4